MTKPKRPREATTYEERQNRLQYGELTDHGKEVHDAYCRGSLDTLKWIALTVGIVVAFWILGTCYIDSSI